GEDAADHDLAPPRAEDDLRRRDVARRPREVARRARPHADVREHDALVAERRAAARAARRVADRLRHVPADRVVVDAEVRDVRLLADRQARDEGVVGVEPERLWIGAQPVARAMSESIREVVVFPFVPLTHTTPCGSSRESALMKSGSSVSATSPGSAVAPRPMTRRPSRVSLPAVLATIASASGTSLSVVALGGDGRDLAEEDFELVDRAAEPQRERLGGIAVGVRLLERSL